MYHNLIRHTSSYFNSSYKILNSCTGCGYASQSVLHMSGLCSTLFILCMTFEHFYSIIRPHKAASFNTLERAKIIIVIAVVFSIVINIPHLYTITNNGKSCVPFGRSMQTLHGQMYYWFSALLNIIFPLILLLSMNSVIIHT